ncbi:hypothetical protein [Zoogloea dura]
MVWGPGRMGSLCIWEISHSPAFELVGVRAYSESKCGVDAGDLVGIAPMGITLTCDVDALLRIDCDCIVYTAHDEGRYHTDDEILMLLAAGKNVVTPQGSRSYPSDINPPPHRRRSLAQPPTPARQPETHPRSQPAIAWS